MAWSAQTGIKKYKVENEKTRCLKTFENVVWIEMLMEKKSRLVEYI